MGGAVVLSACSSGPTYETLTSRAASTSTLVGHAVLINSTTNSVSRSVASGTLTHDTGRTVVSDGTYTLVDNNGFDANNTLDDGQGGRLVASGLKGQTGTYDYAVGYYSVYTARGQDYSAIGVGGIGTKSVDMPSAGSATYTGSSDVLIATGGNPVSIASLEHGTSTVTANFNSGTVDATLSNFTGYNSSGQQINTPLDTISVTDMTISGSGFSGGTVVTTKNSAVVHVEGFNSSSFTGGDFYGYDGTISKPDEVGGMIYIEGNNGIIIGRYIAD